MMSDVGWRMSNFNFISDIRHPTSDISGNMEFADHIIANGVAVNTIGTDK